MKLMPGDRNPVRSYSDLRGALDSVYLYKALHERGLLYLYEKWESATRCVGDEPDFEPDIVFDALHSLSEAVWSRYSEHTVIHTMYFSHPAMMRYYRLCRVYSRKYAVTLRDNPFMRQAAEYVRDKLEQGDYSCSYHLQTKVNGEWASGVVFQMWPEFTGYLALLVLMGRIFDFYERELARLQSALAQSNGRVPENQWKEAA